MERRQFLKVGLLGAGSLLVPSVKGFAADTPDSPAGATARGANAGVAADGATPSGKMAYLPGEGLQLRFFPYELKLKHAFNLAKFSRTTTPDVQVEITWHGVTGYGEASMPPYLGESVESVTKFLSSPSNLNSCLMG